MFKSTSGFDTHIGISLYLLLRYQCLQVEFLVDTAAVCLAMSLFNFSPAVWFRHSLTLLFSSYRSFLLFSFIVLPRQTATCTCLGTLWEMLEDNPLLHGLGHRALWSAHKMDARFLQDWKGRDVTLRWEKSYGSSAENRIICLSAYPSLFNVCFKLSEVYNVIKQIS